MYINLNLYKAEKWLKTLRRLAEQSDELNEQKLSEIYTVCADKLTIALAHIRECRANRLDFIIVNRAIKSVDLMEGNANEPEPEIGFRYGSGLFL